jgi:hypothetical protein
MSVHELKTLARKHWEEHLPKKVQELRAAGELNDAIHGAAMLTQDEIDHLMKQGYREHEAREVALPMFILLPEEPPDEDDEQARELAEMEREYQTRMAVMNDPDEDLPVR